MRKEKKLPYLPEPIRSELPEGSGRSARYQRRVQDEVYRYGVWAAGKLAMEEADAFCVGEAIRFSLNEELSLLEYGRTRAGSDPVACALVSRKLNDLADQNDRRLRRKFR
jgi:hypothetical protein